MSKTHTITSIALCLFSLCTEAQLIQNPTNFSKGKAFNPDMSANFLGLYGRGTHYSNDRTLAPFNGFSLQETEIQLTSDVDPYLKANVLLSIAQENGSWAIDPEEVFLETISLPKINIKAGKFKTVFGKHSILHTHAFPFIDAPLYQSSIVGDEGLNETGVSSAFLLPTPFYSELILQAITLTNETLYHQSNSGKVGGVAHFKNLLEITDDLTLELGFSGTLGKNNFNLTSTAFGSDFTFKWRPSKLGKYNALVWSTEFMHANRSGFTDTNTNESLSKIGGLSSFIQYQFAERWWIQTRVEQLGITSSPLIERHQKQSALIGFFPSEFSGIRAQFDHEKKSSKDKSDYAFQFQYNITIGAHPAHSY